MRDGVGTYTGSREKQWFCIQTKPKHEDVASINLAVKDIVVFNPKIEEVCRQAKRIAPLFPSYIFANFHLSTQYYSVVWAPGVKEILGYGGQPIPVEEEVVYLIMDRIERREYIQPKLEPKDAVEIKSGIFGGLLGIFETYCTRKERVRVLLELFNQRIAVELNVANLQKVHSA